MNFSHYNKFWHSRAILTIVILAVAISNLTCASAQQVGSITMNRNIEKFKEYRTTDRERALDYAKLILNDLDSTTMTLDAAMVYDFMAEYCENERHRLDEAHALRQRHGRTAIYFCIFCVLSLIFIGALIYSRYRLERKNRLLLKEQAEQELNHKNEIIKIQRLQQFQEQNNIDKLTEELNVAINLSDGRELRMELRRIIRQLQQSAGTGGDWADVEMTLVSSNDMFFENLLKEYPNLTKNERKLCTLIHMNLSTKEIANITHQSTGSINVARSRLRQKFGLTDSDISLISFLDRFKGGSTN